MHHALQTVSSLWLVPLPCACNLSPSAECYTPLASQDTTLGTLETSDPLRAPQNSVKLSVLQDESLEKPFFA